MHEDNYAIVTEYIDVSSFADSYILNELFHTCDVGWTSFFLYKEQNGKLYSGPVWDFDVSSGNCDYNTSSDANTLWSSVTNRWYMALLQFEPFKELVSEKLQHYEALIKNVILQSVEYINECTHSIERNFVRWDILGKPNWPNPPKMVSIDTWEGQMTYLQNWLYESLDYMLSVYCPDWQVV